MEAGKNNTISHFSIERATEAWESLGYYLYTSAVRSALVGDLAASFCGVPIETVSEMEVVIAKDGIKEVVESLASNDKKMNVAGMNLPLLVDGIPVRYIVLGTEHVKLVDSWVDYGDSLGEEGLICFELLRGNVDIAKRLIAACTPALRLMREAVESTVPEMLQVFDDLVRQVKEEESGEADVIEEFTVSPRDFDIWKILKAHKDADTPILVYGGGEAGWCIALAPRAFMRRIRAVEMGYAVKDPAGIKLSKDGKTIMGRRAVWEEASIDGGFIQFGGRKRTENAAKRLLREVQEAENAAVTIQVKPVTLGE